MANEEHLSILKQGAQVWNKWRNANPSVRPDLSWADLFEVDLSRTDLRRAILVGADLTSAYLHGANLAEANLSETDFTRAGLTGANLTKADLTRADFTLADLTGANLSGANLYRAMLVGADLTKAILTGADLSCASLVRTCLEGSSLAGCRVYGISAWDLRIDGAAQEGLIVTPAWEPTITVDNIEVAQFIYLLLENKKLRDVIDIVTSKVVLILGRFKSERKAVLNAFREELRKHDYLPVMFDFVPGPSSRDVDETVSLLARMARFVIADVTEARCIPQELKGFVESNLSIPVLPCVAKGVDIEYGMFDHFKRYPQVLAPFEYTGQYDAINWLRTSIPIIEAKVKEQRPK